MNKLEVVACAAHMANRAVCIMNGDESQVPWSDAPEWQRESAIKGVSGALAGNTPEQQHEAWTQHKVAEGWVFGPEKDAERKTHPCLVPYAQLPPAQQVKDRVYIDTVRAVAALVL